MFLFFQGGSTNEIIISAIAFISVILFSLSIHEYGHAYMAYKQGDDTAKHLGRLTLNPLKHLDPIGFLMLMIIGFGYAKPVPINPSKFKNYKSGMIKVSLAGIVLNLIFFLFFIILAALLYSNIIVFNEFSSIGFFIENIIIYGSIINFMLAFFNLIPLYPLDGYNLTKTILNDNYNYVRFNQAYGTILLLLFFVFNIFGYILNLAFQNIYVPILEFIMGLL